MKNAKTKHKSVKSTAAEKSYEGPSEVDFDSGLVIQGLDAWRKYRRWRKQLVSIRPELRKAFPNDKSVNEALQKFLESQEKLKIVRSSKRRKSA